MGKRRRGPFEKKEERKRRRRNENKGGIAVLRGFTSESMTLCRSSVGPWNDFQSERGKVSLYGVWSPFYGDLPSPRSFVSIGPIVPQGGSSASVLFRFRHSLSSTRF